MPPKRPRIVPSQTNLSVQDVRDYSTSDGASMANEEMRRLKMALQEVQEKQAQAVTDQQAAISPTPTPSAPTPPETVTSTYTWTLKAENYREAVIQDKQVVTFRGIDGIRISQVGRTITIGQPRVTWILRADSGTHTVRYEGIVRVRGVNGVTTRAFPGNPLGTLEIDRPLTVYQRGNAIGDAGTVGLDFFNHSNYINKQEHNQVHFQVQDYGSGIRRITGWAKKGDTSSLEGALSTVWIHDLVNTETAYVGYNPINGFNTALFVGPWGFQTAQNSTTPIALSGYSNIAKDTQWSMGVSIQSSAVGPYTYTGMVDTAGLYWVYSTTQGIRWLFDENWAPFVSQRIQYFLVIKRNNYPEQGETYKIYKPLDVISWDMYFPVGTPTSTIVANMSSVDWSVNGGAMVYLEAGDEICHLLTFQNPTGGYNRTSYGVGYHAVEACLVADSTTLDPATQVDIWPINDGELVQNYQLFQFINV